MRRNFTKFPHPRIEMRRTLPGRIPGLRTALHYAIKSIMNLRRPCMLLFTSLALYSCVGTSPETENRKAQNSYPGSRQNGRDIADAYTPSALMGDGPGARQATQLTASTQEEMLNSINSGAVFFTDPHNTEADIPGMEEAFARKKVNERWIQSYASALREAYSTGKPILIWFHHSKGSPPSKKLGAELLQTREFEEWAKQNVIRVCYDQAEEFENERIGKKKNRMKNYVRNAPARFGVKGTPVLLIMAPDGARVDTMRGYYTGQNRLYFDQIKNSAKLAASQYEEFKNKLTPKGYRTWTGINGSTMFAKLSRYSDKIQTVWLQEFDGHQTRTSLRNLSEPDRKWVLEQQEAGENGRRNARPRP